MMTYTNKQLLIKNKYALPKEGPVAIPLLASKDHRYTLPVGNTQLILKPHVERDWIYSIFREKDYARVSTGIRKMVRGLLTPMQIESAINTFIEDHPLSKIDEYSYSDVPMYADPDNGITIPIPSYNCVISLEQERKLLDMVINNPHKSVRFEIANWFKDYCWKYDLDYSKCGGEQFKCLADTFLKQHGISPWELPAEATKQKEEITLRGILRLTGAFGVWEGLLSLFYYLGETCESFFLEGFFWLMFFVWLAVPYELGKRIK